MKINRHETHDRFEQFQDQWQVISQGCMDCMNNVPDAIISPFYVFAHPRTIEMDEKIDIMINARGQLQNVPTTRMIWTPRITKPKPQTNSYLFLAQKNTDVIQVIWLLPPRELWDQYQPGKMNHNQDVYTSIQNFIHNREKMAEVEPNGPTQSDEVHWRKVYAHEAEKRQNQKSLQAQMDKLYLSE